MGNRTVQRIYICAVCGDIPEDGATMWHMGNEVWCESCCDEAENPQPDEPEN